jgi:sarcosine oxidase
LADDGGVDWDVAVVGMGVLGSAALRALAQDGRRAVGIEQYRLGHANGSSHGRSRAVRFLYHAPEYVALLRPAVDGWRDLQREAGTRIYHECGTLFFARPGNAHLAHNVAVMAAAGLPHERLDGPAARHQFPAFAMTDGAEGVWNPDGGFVDADAAVQAFQAGARASGAEIHELTRVVGLDVRGDGVRLSTDDGASLSAGHVIIAGGAWTNDLVPALRLPIRVTGQTWVTMRAADPAAVGPDRVPVWCDYDTLIYGFPDHGPGLKVADDTPAQDVVPDAVDRRPDGSEQRRLAAYLQARFPTSDLTFDEAATCLYTLTPDEDFLLGPVPGMGGRVSLVVGLNHAFKFAPVIGRILADFATTGTTTHPIERFRVDRFGGGAP